MQSLIGKKALMPCIPIYHLLANNICVLHVSIFSVFPFEFTSHNSKPKFSLLLTWERNDNTGMLLSLLVILVGH